MNKAELLKKQAQVNSDSLYLSNESINKEESAQIIEQNKNNIKTNDSKIENEMKMLSFRIPQYLIDNIDKYSYVQRIKKQDVIIKSFETFFNNEKVQDILKEYDKIKGESENDR